MSKKSSLKTSKNSIVDTLSCWKKQLYILIFINVATIICFFTILSNNNDKQYFECRTDDCDPPIYLPIVQSFVEPIGEKNIIFVETRAHKSGISILNPRQACVIEAASKVNPDWNIFLLILDSQMYRMDALWSIVRLLNNVHIKLIDAETFTKGTPTEKLMARGLITKPEWLVSHTSDVLRYTALYKYAGVYMDLDMISIRPLNVVSPNFVCQENALSDDLNIGSAIVGFGNDEVGRKMAKYVVEDVAMNFTGTQWAANGLATLTRSVEKLCKTGKISEATTKKCNGFKVLPTEAFFAIPFYQSEVFFDESKYVDGMKKLNPSIGSHFWNYLSAKFKSGKDEKTVFNVLAKTLCPKVYDVVNNYL